MIRPLLWLPVLALSVTPALAQVASLEKQATKLHALAGGDWCLSDENSYVPDDAYVSWTFSYKPDWSADAPEEDVTLIRIFCYAGAYNISHAYYIHTEMEGLRPLALAVPSFKTKYEDDDLLDGKLESLTVTGMGATTVLVNSDFDPEELTISSNSYWRGIGDASSSGLWAFHQGEFSLVRYDIDASYDGEINPETVLDYTDAQ